MPDPINKQLQSTQAPPQLPSYSSPGKPSKRQRDTGYERSKPSSNTAFELPPPRDPSMSSSSSSSSLAPLPLPLPSERLSFFKDAINTALPPRARTQTKRLADDAETLTSRRPRTSSSLASPASSPHQPSSSSGLTPTRLSASKRGRPSIVNESESPEQAHLNQCMFEHNQAIIAYAKKMNDVDLLQRALTMLNAHPLPHSLSFVLALTYLGTTHLDDFNNAEQARILYCRAYDIFKKLPQKNKNQKTQALLLTNIGTVYEELKRPEDAVLWFEPALTLEPWVEPSEFARFLTNYANALDDLGDTYGAVKLYERALSIREKEDDLFQLAVVLHNLGSACEVLGENTRAHSYYQRALTIREQLQGENHLDVAEVLSNMSLVVLPYIAKPLLDRAWQIKKAAVRDGTQERKDLAAVATNMGRTYLYLKDYPNAEKWLARSLDLQQSPGHSDWQLLVETKMYQGELLLAQRREEDAQDILDEVDIMATEFNRHLTLLAHIKLMLAKVYHKLGNYQIGLKECDRALNIFKHNKFPDDHAFITKATLLKGKIEETMKLEEHLSSSFNSSHSSSSSSDSTYASNYSSNSDSTSSISETTDEDSDSDSEEIHLVSYRLEQDQQSEVIDISSDAECDSDDYRGSIPRMG